MKHSNFDSILEAIRKQELTEFREALKQHGGTYYFHDEDEILKQRDGEWVDDEFNPHIYVTGGSTVQESHELVVHYVELNEDDNTIRVYGREFYDGERTYSCEWQVEQGSWFEMMDDMEEPDEDEADEE